MELNRIIAIGAALSLLTDGVGASGSRTVQRFGSAETLFSSEALTSAPSFYTEIPFSISTTHRVFHTAARRALGADAGRSAELWNFTVDLLENALFFTAGFSVSMGGGAGGRFRSRTEPVPTPHDRTEIPYDQVIVRVESWAAAHAARNVIAHLRHAGFPLPLYAKVASMGLDRFRVADLIQLFEPWPGVYDPNRAWPEGRALQLLINGAAMIGGWVGPYDYELPGMRLKAAATPMNAEAQSSLRKALRMSSNRLEIVLASFESTDSPIFSLLAMKLRPLLESGRLRLIIVPRRLYQQDVWHNAVRELRLPMAVRYRNVQGNSVFRGADTDPVLLNGTEGELSAIEGLAHAVVMGHTWLPGDAGHNIAEPVLAGAPVLFGPFLGFNCFYTDPIVNAGAGLALDNAAVLAEKLMSFVVDRRALNKMKIATAAAHDAIETEVTVPALHTLFEHILRIPVVPMLSAA